jgi:DNA-binding NarL/FixJ family response regulator
MNKVRVILADDHAVVREGLKRLIENEPDIDVVGEAEDGRGAVDQARKLSPDVAVIDVTMVPVGGLQATREMREHCPNTRVLALTVHEDRSYVQELLEAGASGYVLKRAAGEELIGAIRAVASKGIYVDPRVAGKLISVLSQRRVNNSDSVAELSDRETAVMRLIAQGFTNKEISAQLGVSVKTVETYKARSMEKLGLRSRVDIVRTGRDRGWLDSR